jgi:hypothetical protein
MAKGKEKITCLLNPLKFILFFFLLYEIEKDKIAETDEKLFKKTLLINIVVWFIVTVLFGTYTLMTIKESILSTIFLE